MVGMRAKIGGIVGLFVLSAPVAGDLVIGGDPRVDPGDFRITTFANGLNYPLGMTELADGSILVAVSRGSRFWETSSGRLIRLADTDDDGVADSETVLFDGVPGGRLTAVRTAGSLILTCGFGSPISILRPGAAPDAPLTLIGSVEISYPDRWMHRNSALGVRESPGRPGSYDLIFQLGSEENFITTERTLPLSSDIGLSGDLKGDAVHMFTITDHGDSVTGSDLVQIATGLRNAAGFAFHPENGDLYLQDNGIDGLEDGNEAHSADEINVIPIDAIGGAVDDFGFPDNYVAYRSGEFVGGGGVPPLIAFLPLPDPQNGEESEGPSDIAFAPPGFPSEFSMGLFVGFHGKGSAGPDNEENPLVFVDLDSGHYFHFVDNDQPGIGHLDGLLATDNDLYVADLSRKGSLDAANQGVIYQIRSGMSTAVEEAASDQVPLQVELAPAYPNPFNGRTSIRFAVPDAGEVRMTVYSLAGQRVATLIDGLRDAGSYTVRWDGRNDDGRRLGSGVYLYQLRVAERIWTRKLMLLQ